MSDEPLWQRKLIFSLWALTPAVLALIALWSRPDDAAVKQAGMEILRWLIFVPLGVWILRTAVMP